MAPQPRPEWWAEATLRLRERVCGKDEEARVAFQVVERASLPEGWRLRHGESSGCFVEQAGRFMWHSSRDREGGSLARGGHWLTRLEAGSAVLAEAIHSAMAEIRFWTCEPGEGVGSSAAEKSEGTGRGR